MELLKKKLKTDEDLAWVDHSKTLDEQEIHEQDVVLLRRRFFYSDQNIDTRDPLPLGLLYVQTRDAILSGTHPVTLDGACKFAGIQAQAQLGDYVEGKTTRPGYINLKDYLPADYAKQKHIERKVFQEHKKYYGLSELEAKAKYISEARSLSTYGVTFFLVKEKLPGKNKLVPRLLGITKDCVMRVDADTKGILKTWPLTTVKRWAPSKNSFTLDFGDYSDSYYSVQTSEGEQISQLIAGYIDIILKRRKAKDHFGIEGDEGATMIEDSVAPSRATIIQNQPALARPPSAAASQVDLSSVAGPTVERQLREEGPHVEPAQVTPGFEIRGKAEIGYEARPLTQYPTNYELSVPQRDLQDRLEQAQDAVEAAQKVLDRAQLTEVERTRATGAQAVEVEQKKRKLSSQFAEINAATAQLVSLSAIPEEELNYGELNEAVETVATSLPSVVRDVKVVAALMEDDESGERLIEAARRLCKAFSDLLNAAEPGPTVPRQTLISAASRVGDATQALLYTINSSEEQPQSQSQTLANGDSSEQAAREREAADTLLALAKSVASSAAALVLRAKDVGSSCQDKELSNQVIGAATQCALATSQMVATAKIVTPTIEDNQCQRRLLEACAGVQRAVDGIEGACERAIAHEQLQQCNVDEAVLRVNQALAELVEHIRSIKQQRPAARFAADQSTRGQPQTRSKQTSSTSTTTTTTVHRIVDEHTGRPLAAGSHEDLSQASEDSNKRELMHQARNLARATTQLIQDMRPSGNEQQRSVNAASLGHGNLGHGNLGHSNTLGRHEQRPQAASQPYQSNTYSAARERRLQQQHQQQQQVNVKTVTTTLHDDHYDEQSGAGHNSAGYSLKNNSSNVVNNSPNINNNNNNFDSYNFRPAGERPVSMYDSEQSADYHGRGGLGQDSARESIEQQSMQSVHGESTHQPMQSTHQSMQSMQPEAAISGIVGDLETSILFATSGSLRAQQLDESYLEQRESVLRCAKALVEDTRPLVASAAADQAQLARAARDSVQTMAQLAETVKRSAASLGPDNAQSQVGLIRSVREVAISLADLIGATKGALGCHSNDPRLVQVKDSAKSMVASVTSLLRTVKAVEDEQQRGCRAIEEAIRTIEQELANYEAQCSSQSQANGEGGAPGSGAEATSSSAASSAGPQELVRVSRPLTMAAAKTVHAGSTGQQDDAIVASNMGSKAVADLLQTSQLVALSASSYQLRSRIQQAARECAQNYKHLIELLYKIFQHPSNASTNPNVKQELINQSKVITNSITELINSSELLKGTSQPNNNNLNNYNNYTLSLSSDNFNTGNNNSNRVSSTVTVTEEKLTTSNYASQTSQRNEEPATLDQVARNWAQSPSSSKPQAEISQQQQQQMQQHNFDPNGRQTSYANTQSFDNNHSFLSSSAGHQFPLIDRPNASSLAANDEPKAIVQSEFLVAAASSVDAAGRKLDNLKPRVTSVKVS